MEKRSIRFITLLLVLSMLFALSLTAFAGSTSHTVIRSGYNCACYLSVSEYSASASLDCTLIPGLMGPMDPEVMIDGTAEDAYEQPTAFLFDRGFNSVSDSKSWSDFRAVKVTCFYTFLGNIIALLEALV